MITKIKQFCINSKAEIFLFGLVFLLILIRFGETLFSTELPGWDTPSHYYTLSKMTFDYLPNGQISGYMFEWLGGMPLFQFYAPLYFIVVGSLYWVFFGQIPLVFLFHLSLLVLLFFLVFSFWFFLKTFFDKGVARWGIIISLVFIFFPLSYAPVGMGAGGLLEIGLVPGFLGLSFVLLFLSTIEGWRKNQNQSIYFVYLSIVWFLLILTHTLSTIAAGFLFGIYVLLNVRNPKFILKLLASFLFGCLLSAFWLIPFIFGLGLTSTEALEIKNLFSIIFPLEIQYYNIVTAINLFFVVCGMFLLFINKKYFFIILSISFTLFVFDGYKFLNFLGFPVHYYRFISIVYFLVLAYISYFLNWFWHKFASSSSRRILYTCLFLFTYFISGFVLFDSRHYGDLNDSVNFRSISFDQSDFPMDKEARKVIKKISEFDDVYRIMVEMTDTESSINLGGPAYFVTKIPQYTNLDSISGQYAQSSPLTPYIMPTIAALTNHKTRTWGENNLDKLIFFSQQDIDIQLNRLELLGVNYVVSYSDDFSDKIIGLDDVFIVDQTDNFKILKLINASPYIYSSKFKPAVFVNTNNYISFKDLSQLMFAHEELFNLPVINGGKSIIDLDERMINHSSLLVVSASEISNKEKEHLSQIDVPIIFIGDTKPNIDIDSNKIEFSKMDRFKGVVNSNKTDDLNGFYEKVLGFKKDNFLISSVEVKELTNKNIKIRNAEGFTMLNFGYSPYWKTKKCSDCQIFQVSPSQMVVFGEGDIELEYTADLTKKISAIISILSFMLLIFGIIISTNRYRKFLR